MQGPKKLFVKYKLPVYSFLVGVGLSLLALYGLYYFELISISSEPSPASQVLCPDVSELSSDADPKRLLVDIRGAVKKPGVYEYKKGNIVDELVRLAGGLLAQADMTWIDQNINFARDVKDREKLYFPYKQQVRVTSSVSTTGSKISGKVNINTSTKSELEDLPGIGPATADKIIQGRPYKAINDLLDVKGIGEALLEKIRDLIEV